MAARGARLGLTEAIKYVRQEFFANAYTRVSDFDFHEVLIAARNNLDAATRGSELDRVAQQVPHNLLNPVRVGADDADIVSNLRLKVDSPIVAHRANSLDSILNRTGRGVPAQREPQIAGGNAGH